MLNDNKITVGVSAHRNIAAEYEKDILKLAVEAFKDLKARFPAAEIITLNGLAAGGDLLCAEAALACGVKIKAVLPVPEKFYLNSRDFSAIQRENYFKIKQAAEIEKVYAISCDFGNTEEERNAAFRAQTEYVATECDYLLALWDGAPEKENNACGTAAAVRFALEKGVKVIWIFSPREGQSFNDRKPFLKWKV